MKDVWAFSKNSIGVSSGGLLFTAPTFLSGFFKAL